MLEHATALWKSSRHLRRMQEAERGPERVREAKAALAWLRRLQACRGRVPSDDPEREYLRVSELSEIAWAAFEAGEYEAAEREARGVLRIPDLVRAANFTTRVSWGDEPMHLAHIVLGRLAFVRGDLPKADHHLLEAASSVVESPSLGTGGPDTELARDLLVAGRPDTVLEYLRSCRRFWKMGWDQLDEWIAQLERGERPDLSRRSLRFRRRPSARRR